MKQHVHRSSAIAAAILSISLLSMPSITSADEIGDKIVAALEAYQAGDISGARSEIGNAEQLLAHRRSVELLGMLPEPFRGWSQEDAETAAIDSAIFGGGLTARAGYRTEDHDIEIQVVAESPILPSMIAMFADPAMVGATGKLRRIEGYRIVETHDGEIQALISDRLMVHIEGSAPIEDKEAYFSALDFDALQRF